MMHALTGLCKNRVTRADYIDYKKRLTYDYADFGMLAYLKSVVHLAGSKPHTYSDDVRGSLLNND